LMFQVGPVKISFQGNSFVRGLVEKIFESLDVPEGPADVIFEFSDTLSPPPDSQSTRINNFVVGDDYFRLDDRVLMIHFARQGSAWHITVAPRYLTGLRGLKLRLGKGYRYLVTHGRSWRWHFLKRFVFYAYLPFMQFALLARGDSFVHASAVVRGSKAVLFPSWGGVGKTAIMTHMMIQEPQCRFVGDDLLILDHLGDVRLHPLPMHLYKYHARLFPEFFDRMLSNTSRRDRLLWRLLSPFCADDGIVRWVRPLDVFGAERLVPNAAVTCVVWLYRAAGDSLALDGFEPSLLAHSMAAMLMEEVNYLTQMSILLNVTDLDRFVPHLGKLYGQIHAANLAGIEKAKCYRLGVPEGSRAEQICRFLQDRSVL